MGFKLDDDSLEIVYDNFGHIEEKLVTDLNNFKVKNILKQLCLMKHTL